MVKEKWMVSAKKADFEAIANEFHINPVTARILRNRDVVSNEEIRKFLNGTMEDLHAPEKMKDMEKASRIIREAIEQKKHLRIIGDYDVDGICSTFILYRGFAFLGAEADTVIPHRMKDGYGLNEQLIRDAAEQGVELIITCDNGIAAKNQIDLSNSLSVPVVVTDHHEVPFEEENGKKRFILPNALAVVDPHREDCEYPYAGICGAVVAYKLITCMVKGMEGERELLRDLLPFAALATVCDVMELRDENRILVKEGLLEMQKTNNLGLKALIAVNGMENKKLSPYHAGFILGPCMNATGRLDTALKALELFKASKWNEAVSIASELKELNESRKEMTEKGIKQAMELIEEKKLSKDAVLVVYLPECHESLAGIIAGRIRENYGKPTFVLTKGEEGIKGSGRSIEAYHMFEEMNKCRELFVKFGGHKLAAGLSLPDEESVEIFRRTMNQNATLTEEDFVHVVHIDVPMPLSYVTEEFLEEIDQLEPFGNGNPKPLFARKDIALLQGTKFGKNKRVAKYRICDETGHKYNMIYFGNGEDFDSFLKEKYGEEKVDSLYQNRETKGITISMVYYPELNEYMGRTDIQFVMQNYC